MQGNSLRIAVVIALAAWLSHFAAALAQDVGRAPDDPTGFWIVSEHGPPVNEGLAAIPLLGLAVRPQIGNPRAVVEIDKVGDVYSLEIPSRSLRFSKLTQDGPRLKGEVVDPGTNSGRISIDVAIADGRLTGRLVYPTFAFDLDGRLPQSVEALRQELAAARARLAEIDGPYVVPEIERLRQENIVLIQRIRRVEDELRSRGSAAQTRVPASAADIPAIPSPPNRVSTAGLVADQPLRVAVDLKAAPANGSETRATIPAGQTFYRLADAGVPGWIFAADQRGTVGFLEISRLAPAAPIALTASRSAREISVSFPAWDQGRVGKRMTISDAGYISVIGRIRGDAPLSDVQIADAQTVFNADGSFTSVMAVPREGRKVRIEAFFQSGPPVRLDFEISVAQR